MADVVLRVTGVNKRFGGLQALSDVGIDDDFLKELAHGLTRGSSALFVLVRKSTPDKVLEKLKGTGGKILTTSLKHEDAAKLQAAISAPNT